jgi:hypothetical protein
MEFPIFRVSLFLNEWGSGCRQMWWVKPNSRAWVQWWELSARHSQTPFVSCLVLQRGLCEESEIEFIGGLLVYEISQAKISLPISMPYNIW